MTHFGADTSIVVHDTGLRGVQIRPSKSDGHMHILLHNGCGRGNMRAILTNDLAIKLATAILVMAQRKDNGK